MNEEQFRQVTDEIKQRTKMTAYSLVIQKDVQPGIFDSKFGGVPYWTPGRDYPKDKNGKPLMLLAQINFDKADVDKRLPQRGMLQFFTGLDEIFGANFDNPDCQDSFRVIYHESIDYAVSEDRIAALDVPVSTDPDLKLYSPVFQDAVVELVRKEVCMSWGDYRFEQIFLDIVKEKFGEDLKGQSLYQFLDDGEYDKIIEEFSGAGHWLLGYPYFTQQDPREYEEEFQKYNTLLFQMDSDSIGDVDYVLWGDCGVANFFIQNEDLERLDFSKVLYNWDCC